MNENGPQRKQCADNVLGINRHDAAFVDKRKKMLDF